RWWAWKFLLAFRRLLGCSFRARRSGFPGTPVGAQELGAEFGERPLPDRRPDLGHEPVQESQVVPGGQAHGQHFAGFEQVADVGTGVVSADVAIAIRIQRAKIAGIAGVADDDRPRPGEHAAVAPYPGRQDAVKHVDAPGDPLDRKSTRLNSSHETRSYAVFCLK